MRSAMTKNISIFFIFIVRPNFFATSCTHIPSCGNQKFDILPVCNLLGQVDHLYNYAVNKDDPGI